MAEFKLGRIKFVYQGAWASSTAYVVDDVVTVGGKTYICVQSNTSSSIFGTDFNSGYWNIVADGSRWTGNWANGNYYQLGDQVLYGGVVYLCTTAHTGASATATLTATAATADGTTATITFAQQVVQPYLVGASITVAGFTSQTGFNGTFTVTACTRTTVSYALAQTLTGTVMGTVAGASQLGLEKDQSYWTAFASNINWISGGWTVNTRYKVKDLINYNGITYVCNAAHVSASTTSLGLENDQSKWDVFNAGMYYTGTWATSTRYKLNDIVKAGASLYICTTQHTSTGATIDTTKFTIFVNGVEFLNAWNSSTNYIVGDIVTYGGNTYTCILNGINQNPVTATTYWQLFTAGFSFQNDWSSASSYKIGSVVRLGGYTYLAIADSATIVLSATATTVGTNVITVSSNAGLVANLPITFTGTTFGNIVNGTTYYVLNPNAGTNQITVSSQPSGTVFALATASGTMTGTTNPTPPFSTYWTRLNSGIRWNATNGSYSSISATNVTGSGANATFTILATKTNYTVTLSAGGTGYSATTGSNTIKLLGSSLGGLSPANDITITITGVSNGAITTFTSTGFSVTWASGTSYVLGDAVYFGANSYICVSAHIAASGNRPDADTTGTYWNLLASGSESAVLTTTGDLAYYGTTGPTRLPIGTDGQILRVTGTVPGWAYYGLINNIVYVSPQGVDTLVAGQGLTIDKPWATIRYACYQIENGYLASGATPLLQINKQFIIKETNNFVQNQYSVNVTSTSGFTINVGGSSTSSLTSTANLYQGMPIVFSNSSGNIVAGTVYYVASIISATQFNIATSYTNAFIPTLFQVGTGTTNVGTYSYSASRTERDAGIVLDGIIFDLGHGGNWKTTTNTQAYFTYPYPSTTLASGVNTYDLPPFIAAMNYLNTLCTAVLNNVAPTYNYQTLNGISLGNRAIQNVTSGNTALTADINRVQPLVATLTSALTLVSTNGMPPLQTPNTTISVKTGTYNEVLPIVVPSYTAIVGDELRSTVVQPSPTIANLVNDKPKSIATLTRIQSLLPNLISNTTITPTTGNTVSQVTNLPAGDVGSSASANAVLTNISTISNMISNGLQQAPAFSYTTPTSYNTSYLVGYGFGTAQIAQNYNFIKAEIAAYLNINYNGVWSTFGSTNQTETLRDVGFVLDGIIYDMTYGCNNQSLINGSAYYSLQIPQILTAYSAATTAALTRLQTIIGTIVTAGSVSPTSGNTVVQLLSGSAGTTAAAAFAQARVGDVLYWLANGTPNPGSAVFVGSSSSSTTLTVSSVTSGTIAIGMCITGTGIAAGTYIVSGSGTTWTMSISQTISSGTVINGTMAITPIVSGAYALASSTLQGVYTNLQSRRAEIASDAQAYVVKYYQAYPISGTLTNRDAGLIVDTLSWDLLLGTNANSIAAGRAYNRLNTSATALRNNVNNELTATLAALTFIGFKAKLAAANGSVTQASLLIDDMISTINGQAQVSTFATSITSNNITLTSGTNVTVGNSVVFGGNLGALVQGTTYYVLTVSGNVITVATSYGGSVFAAGTVNTVTGQVSATFSPVVTSVTTSTNLLTLTNTTGMVVNQPITFTGLTAPITASASATSSSGNTITLSASATSLGIAIGQQIYFTGNVFGNLVPNQMYYVLTTVGATITVSLVASGSSVNLVTASGSMGVTANASGNLWNGNTYWINSISGSQITVTSTFKSGTAYVINNTVTGMSGTATAGYVTKVLYLNNPMINGSTTYNNILASINGTEIIRTNIGFLAQEAIAYTLASYGGGANALTGTTFSTNVITTSSAHNFTVGDPVQFSATTVTTTATSVSSNVITVGSTTGMVIGMPIVFTGTNIANIVNGTTYYVLTIPNGTTITVSASYNGSVFAAGTGTGTMSVNAGGLFGGLVAGTEYYVLTTPSTTTFTISSTPASAGTQSAVALSTAYGIATANYYFVWTKCTRDTTNYLNAIIYDINYLGNYKTQRAAELYVNAIAGSASSNFYLVRNACGVRNQTMNGLTGYLSGVNSFGTKRPTGGAYTSLDPGFGPNDTNVQILTRSTYVQNCTMFGYAVVGAKVDGALHSAGNKSIVANDYTCVIGDGIGWWNTGTGSLAELVSVFNYYSYAGYLAELGGRIRATNGNSSYGTYGVVSETVDTFETPIYGTVNNRAFGSQPTNVVTDSTTQILRVEYGNTGQNYTNSVVTISGAGYNILATQDEFRDAAVIENRLIDLNNGQGVGGSYYVSASNTAQGVTSGQPTTGFITISATDTALTGAYNGMRVQLIAGTGVGQYANILSYTNGSKVATIIRPTFVTLTITATTNGTPSTVTVASTVTLYANMPFYVGTAVGGLATGTVYYVKTIVNGTTFSVTDTSGGTAFTSQITTTTSQSVALYAAGWDHVVSGSTTVSALDSTTTYIIEPAISFAGPGYTATARTMPSTGSWNAVGYGANNYVAVVTGGTATAFSTTGKTWTAGGALSASTTWNQVAYGGGQGATVSITVGGFGGSNAVLQAVLGTGSTLSQVVSVNVINGGYNYTTPPTLTFTATNGGSGATATCTVLNGAITSVTVTIGGSGYNTAPTVNVVTSSVTAVTPITYGKNYLSTPTVTISAPFSGTVWSSSGSVTLGNYYYYYNSGTASTNYYLANANGTFNSTPPAFTTGTQATGYGVSLTYVGTLATVTPTLTNNGLSAYAITNGGFGYTSVPTITITDGASRFVAIANSGQTAYQLPTSLVGAWTAGGALPSANFTSLAWGNGIYVAVGGTGTTPAASSSADNGASWVSRSIPGSVTYSSVAWGPSGYNNPSTSGSTTIGLFIAVATGSNVTAYSTNGTTWSAGGNLPSSTTWTSIAYGNNRYVAVASGGTSVAYSINGGYSWTAAPTGLPVSQNWSNIAYGEGLFIATAPGSAICATSPDGINWVAQAMPSSSNWSGITFGNPTATSTGTNPLWVAVSSTSGTIGASLHTGATATGRVKVVSNTVTEIRLVEPGSGYPKGLVSATTTGTNLITVDNTENLVANQPVEFNTVSSGNLTTNTTYYVIGSSITSSTFQVSAVAGSGTPVTLATSAPTGMIYTAGPIATVTDPNRVNTVAIRVRTSDGALANPSFANRGQGNSTATATQGGDGFSDLYQNSAYINIAGLYSIPSAGCNVQFASITGSNQWYKLVIVTNVLGVPGNYTAQFQVSPALTTLLAPSHGTVVTTRLKYSQVRLTGHDFLYVGTGNQTQTNYPNVNVSTAVQANQQYSTGGGRNFFTSTDQDGNFNVGNLFGVQQATGTASLNANAFNLAGLQSLTLSGLALGAGSATITQFSTDPYFTANSDNIVPTQKAIKSYITAQIGGGQSQLNVNTLTAGQIFIANNSISNTTGQQIYVSSKMNFTGGIDGAPVALIFFGQH